jgi:hypothetical protein
MTEEKPHIQIFTFRKGQQITDDGLAIRGKDGTVYVALGDPESILHRQIRKAAGLDISQQESGGIVIGGVYRSYSLG